MFVAYREICILHLNSEELRNGSCQTTQNYILYVLSTWFIVNLVYLTYRLRFENYVGFEVGMALHFFNKHVACSYFEICALKHSVHNYLNNFVVWPCFLREICPSTVLYIWS
jgi:hypothetical protein